MSIKRIFLRGLQCVFGSALLLFGLNNIFSFLPLPKHVGFAELFLETIYRTGYIIPIIATVQILVGIALLVNRYVALALIMIFPISLNIFLFHLFHDQGAIIPAIILMMWNTVLLFSRLESYKPLLTQKKAIYVQNK